MGLEIIAFTENIIINSYSVLFFYYYYYSFIVYKYILAFWMVVLTNHLYILYSHSEQLVISRVREEKAAAQVDVVQTRWQKMLACQTNRINKNRGYSSEVKPPPLGALEHADDFTSRHLSNFIVVAGTCVTKTTQVTYTTGWNAFLLYCKLSSTTPSLKVVPPSLLNKVLPYPLAVIVIWQFYVLLISRQKIMPNHSKFLYFCGERWISLTMC